MRNHAWKLNIQSFDPLITGVGDRAASYLPIGAVDLDIITHRISGRKERYIHIGGAVWIQYCNGDIIPIDSETAFAVGGIAPVQIHGHGAAAGGICTGITIRAPAQGIRCIGWGC